MDQRESEAFDAARGAPGDCWTDVGLSNGNGYRFFRWPGGRKRYIHRVSYTAFTGPIPAGLVIDHLCRNRACWNPSHLEAVADAENKRRGESWAARNARKQACPSCGSEYSVGTDGRRCRVCKQGRRTDTKRKGVGRCVDRTHCPHGHPYDAANTYLARRSDGSVKQRMCKQCMRERTRARRAAKGGVAL